jgi:hypothetical protein
MPCGFPWGTVGCHYPIRIGFDARRHQKMPGFGSCGLRDGPGKTPAVSPANRHRMSQKRKLSLDAELGFATNQGAWIYEVFVALAGAGSTGTSHGSCY